MTSRRLLEKAGGGGGSLLADGLSVHSHQGAED